MHDFCKHVRFSIILFTPTTSPHLTTISTSMSVTIISRLMLNLQNPVLFESTGVYTTSAHLGPFVTTVLDRYLRTGEASSSGGYLSSTGGSRWTGVTGTSGTTRTAVSDTQAGCGVEGDQEREREREREARRKRVAYDFRIGDPTWEGWGMSRARGVEGVSVGAVTMEERQPGEEEMETIRGRWTSGGRGEAV